jgi:hypothetical protein
LKKKKVILYAVVYKQEDFMKNLLMQYNSMLAEREELQKRIEMLQSRIERINEEGNIRDAVKGGNGGQQTFRIEGFPVADEDEARYLLNKNIRALRQREHDIEEKVVEVEEFINTLDDSRMRRMITKRFIEGKTWYQVAYEMGEKYTEDSCQKQMERFLNKI